MSGSITPNQSVFSRSERAISFDEMNALVANKTDMIDGSLATRAFPQAISNQAIIADAHMLRAFGAKFDGVTDDGPAFNAIINAATSGGNSIFPAAASGPNGLPTIVFYLPAQIILIGTPILSGSINISMRGKGAQNTILMMASGSTGVWQHGSQSAPSKGYVEIEGVMFQDAKSGGSGCYALSFYFSGGIIPTLRFDTVRFLHFTQMMYLLNPPRDINAYALTGYGPDFPYTSSSVPLPKPGIVIENTATGHTTFTTSWIMCNVFNYSYGWQFLGGNMMEGHRFYGTTCYNGWGMVQAYVQGTAIPGGTGYQAVIWDFYCCDWQGFGYALDMHNCRGIRVRGGFYTFNDRNAVCGSTTVPPWGARTSAATNAMFDFYKCADVIMEGVQIDTSSSGTYSDTVIAHFDDACTHVRVRDNALFVNSALFGGFELGDPNAASIPTNTLKVLENEWLSWVSGDKVIDHAGKQIDLPWLSDNYYGTETQAGIITIQQQVIVTIQAGTVSSTDNTEIGQAYISFPTNRYGNNLFKGGVPTVIMTVQQALTDSQAPFFLGASENHGFYINTTKNMVGVQVTVNYSAMGW